MGLAESNPDAVSDQVPLRKRRLLFITSEEFGSVAGDSHRKQGKFTAMSHSKENFFSLVVGNEVLDVYATSTNEHEVRNTRQKIKGECCQCCSSFQCPKLACCTSADFSWSYSDSMSSKQLQDKLTKSNRTDDSGRGSETEYIVEQHRLVTFMLHGHHHFVMQASPETTSMTLFRFASLCKTVPSDQVNWNDGFKSYDVGPKSSGLSSYFS